MNKKAVIFILLMILVVGMVWGEEKTISLAPIGDGYYLYENEAQSGFELKPTNIKGEYGVFKTAQGLEASGISIGTITVTVDTKDGTKINYAKYPETNFQEGHRPRLTSAQNDFDKFLKEDSSQIAFSHTVARLDKLANGNIYPKKISVTATENEVTDLQSDGISPVKIPITSLYKEGTLVKEVKQTEVKKLTTSSPPVTAQSASGSPAAPGSVTVPAQSTSTLIENEGTVAFSQGIQSTNDYWPFNYKHNYLVINGERTPFYITGEEGNRKLYLDTAGEDPDVISATKAASGDYTIFKQSSLVSGEAQKYDPLINNLIENEDLIEEALKKYDVVVKDTNHDDSKMAQYTLVVHGVETTARTKEENIYEVPNEETAVGKARVAPVPASSSSNAQPTEFAPLQKGQFSTKNGELYYVDNIETEINKDGNNERFVTFTRQYPSGLIEYNRLSYSKNSAEILAIFTGATEATPEAKVKFKEEQSTEITPVILPPSELYVDKDGDPILEGILTRDGSIPRYTIDPKVPPLPASNLKKIQIQYNSLEVRFQDLQPGDILKRYDAATEEYSTPKTVRSVETNKFLWLVPTSNTVTYTDGTTETIRDTQPVQRPVPILPQIKVGDFVKPTQLDTTIFPARQGAIDNKIIEKLETTSSGKLRVTYNDGSIYDLSEQRNREVMRPATQSSSAAALTQPATGATSPAATGGQQSQPTTSADTPAVAAAREELRKAAQAEVNAARATTTPAEKELLAKKTEAARQTLLAAQQHAQAPSVPGSPVTPPEAATATQPGSSPLTPSKTIKVGELYAYGEEFFYVSNIDDKDNIKVTIYDNSGRIREEQNRNGVFFESSGVEKKGTSDNYVIGAINSNERFAAIKSLVSEGNFESNMKTLKEMRDTTPTSELKFNNNQFSLSSETQLPSGKKDGVRKTSTDIFNTQSGERTLTKDETVVQDGKDSSKTTTITAQKLDGSDLNEISTERNYFLPDKDGNIEDAATPVGRFKEITDQATIKDRLTKEKAARETALSDANTAKGTLTEAVTSAEQAISALTAGASETDRTNAQTTLTKAKEALATNAKEIDKLTKERDSAPNPDTTTYLNDLTINDIQYQITTTDGTQKVIKTTLDNKRNIVSTEEFSRAADVYVELDKATEQTKGFWNFGFSEQAKNLQNELVKQGVVTQTRVTIGSWLYSFGGLIKASNEFPGLSAFSNLIRDKGLAKWKETVYEDFTKNVVGGGYFKSKICEKNFKTKAGNGGYLVQKNEGGGYAAGAWLQVDKSERTKVMYGGNILDGYIYRTIFYINNPEYPKDLHLKDQAEDMLYNVVFKTRNKAIKWFAAPQLIEKGKSAGQKNADLTLKDKTLIPIFPSKADYVEACLTFNPKMKTYNKEVGEFCVPITTFQGSTYTKKEQESAKAPQTIAANDGASVIEGD